jgi:hypothetical protein
MAMRLSMMMIVDWTDLLPVFATSNSYARSHSLLDLKEKAIYYSLLPQVFQPPTMEMY